MWDGIDRLGEVVVAASGTAAVVSSLVMLLMLGCRQPARRATLARAAMVGLLAILPLVALAPLPRFELVAFLRGAGVSPHPLWPIATPSTGLGISRPRGRWPSCGLLAAYLAGAGAGLACLCVGHRGMSWLLRQSLPPSVAARSLYETIAPTGRRNSPRLRPRLRVAARVRRPVLLGLFRPTILIPAALDAGARDGDPGSADSLRLSLLHELAHAERHDAWFNMAGNWAQALWFFLPPVWWIHARMRLDHEFLADQRAVRDFGAPGAYAASLVDMAEPPRGRRADGSAPAPLPASKGAGEAVSPLYQRVLMLVQCPFRVESQAPRWWSGSLPILVLLTIPAAASLRLDSEVGRRAPLSLGSRTFHVAWLTLGPETRPRQHRVAPFDLPLHLPDQFDLSLDIRCDRDTLARCRAVGQRLDPGDDGPTVAGAVAAGSPIDEEPWHHVRVRRQHGELAVSIDGRPVRPDPGVVGLTPQLSVETPPDRRVSFRDIHISW
jgi:beta-lactamase regulating signal transducer with metallopeptidase domain